MSVFVAATKKLAESAARRLKAYHGSPHDFDEFSTEAIGTGEGAQAYGRGLYFAEREGTAMSYRDSLTPRDFDYEEYLMEQYKAAESTQDYNRMDMLERAMQHDTPADFRDIASDADYDDDYRQLAADMADEIEGFVNPNGNPVNFGRMYEVDIDTSPDELLDWDKPINEQSPQVQKALSEMGKSDSYRERIYNQAINSGNGHTYRGYGIHEYDGKYYLYENDQIVANAENTDDLIFNNRRDAEKELKTLIDNNQDATSTGAQVYRSLVETNGMDGIGQQIASDALKEKGIKGIKYADAQTRFSSKGKTSNYVIFDDKLLAIARKYGVTLPVASAILAGSMTPEQAQAGFFSQAVKAAQNLTRKTGNAQGFKNDLTGKGQVKPDELKAMGFDEHFGDRKDITKEEVQQFINDNQVQIKETQLGISQEYAVRPDPDEGFIVYNSTNGNHISSHATQENAADKALDLNVNSDNSKFGDYTLEGGDNYRELLMSLPRTAHPDQGKLDELLEMQQKEDYLSDLDAPRDKLLSEYQAVESELVDLSWSEGGADLTGDKLEKSKQLRRQMETINFDVAELSNTRDQRKMDLREQIVDLQHEINQEKRGQEFVNAGHFDEPNILAHLRMKDRVDTDGNKTLLIEEAQSDWHQKGANDGYRNAPPPPELALIKAKADQAQNDFRAFLEKNMDLQAPRIDMERYEQLTSSGEGLRLKEIQKAAVDELMNGDVATKYNRELIHAVPDAPFKTDDKSSWYNLAMKRGLIEAAEGDYDKLAITTGRQQAERYDLSKTIGSLKYQEDMVEGRPVNILTAYDNQGMRVFNRRIDDPEKELPSIIGKDATKSLLEVEPYTPPQETRSIRSLRGQELSVGGEGMEEFYDRKLPNTLNKLVKQDGVKVGQSGLLKGDNLDIHQVIDDTDERIEWLDVKNEVENYGNQNPVVLEKYDAFVSKYKPKTVNTDTVHSIDITPEMRERVKKGLPLFTTAAGVPILNNMFAPKVQAAEYNEAPVIEEQSFGDMVNEYGQINRNLKALDDQRFARLMDEEKKLRAMGSASFGKVSPELAAYRRSQALPSLAEMGMGALDASVDTLDFLSNLPRAAATMQYQGNTPLRNKLGGVLDTNFVDERDEHAIKSNRFFGSLFSPL